MVILGLLLMALGIIAALAAFFVSEGSGELLGVDMSTFAVFCVGLAAGAAILWGFALLKFGTRRELRHAKERRQLNKLNRRLDEAERRDGDEPGENAGPPTA